MSNLTDLPNIGKELAKQLEAAGISSYQDLVDCESLEALLKIKGKFGNGCYNMLYALEGAIQEIRWHGQLLPIPPYPIPFQEI